MSFYLKDKDPLVETGDIYEYFKVYHLLFSDLIRLVLREGVLPRVLVNASSNAEAQYQIFSLPQFLDFNSLLLENKHTKSKIRFLVKHSASAMGSLGAIPHM